MSGDKGDGVNGVDELIGVTGSAGLTGLTGVTEVDRGGQGWTGEEEEEKEKKEEKSLRTNGQKTGPPRVVQEVLADIKRIGIQKIPFAAHENLANMFYSELLVHLLNVSTWYLFWSFL